MAIEVGTSTDEIKLLLDSLAALPKGITQAGVRAVNRTGENVKAEGVRLVRRDYNVKAGEVRKLLKLLRASGSDPDNIEALVLGKGPPGLPMLAFVKGRKKAPSTRRTKGGGYTPKGGISVQVRRDKGKKKLKGGFIAKMKSGKVGVFKRSGGKTKDGKKDAIELKYGPSPIGVLESGRYDQEIEEYSDKMLEKNLRNQVKQLLAKY